MREIRFRAWHKADKRMFKVFRLSWFSGIFLIGDRDSEEGRRFGSGEVILMQFTGLRDKNGKEIYEGDIVVTTNEQVDSYPVEDEFRGVVTYEENKGWFYINQSHDKYTPVLANSTIISIEVVGNIHENPELARGDL